MSVSVVDDVVGLSWEGDVWRVSIAVDGVGRGGKMEDTSDGMKNSASRWRGLSQLLHFSDICRF